MISQIDIEKIIADTLNHQRSIARKARDNKELYNLESAKLEGMEFISDLILQEYEENDDDDEYDDSGAWDNDYASLISGAKLEFDDEEKDLDLPLKNLSSELIEKVFREVGGRGDKE